MKLQKEESSKGADPRQATQERKRRFQIVRLEERIAPTCHLNPHGKCVGNCGKYGCFY